MKLILPKSVQTGYLIPNSNSARLSVISSKVDLVPFSSCGLLHCWISCTSYRKKIITANTTVMAGIAQLLA